MRSLFFKIFACFWLSYLIMVPLIVGVLTSVQERDGDSIDQGRYVRVTNQQMMSYAGATTVLLNHSSPQPAALSTYLDSIQHDSGLRAALFDSNGNAIAGDAPPWLSDIVSQALRSGRGSQVNARGDLSLARRITTANKHVYVLTLQQFPAPPPAAFPDDGGAPGGGPGGGPDGGGPGGPGDAGGPGNPGGPNNFRGPVGRHGGPGVLNRQSGPSTSVLGYQMGPHQFYEIARFIAVFIAAGVVAFGLARYLTAPTIKLRRATQQLAAGDLSTRVGPQMGRRRDELADLGQDFDLMAERIESLMISERRLLGDISHELRSPLARLQVALDLADQSADEETHQYLARIEREAERLNSMIGQLLTLTRLENSPQSGSDTTGVARKGATGLVPLDLEGLIEEVGADADFEARGKGRNVEIVHSETCYAKGNPELLRSAVENVVRNAVLHTPEGTRVEISLQVRSGSELSGEEKVSPEIPGLYDSKVALICVRDKGPGVPPEALTELFRPFYRVAEARDRQSGGVGLGLSITERAVRFHGGTVRASNGTDGGLVVEIVLPLIAAEDAAAASSPTGN